MKSAHERFFLTSYYASKRERMNLQRRIDVTSRASRGALTSIFFYSRDRVRWKGRTTCSLFISQRFAEMCLKFPFVVQRKTRYNNMQIEIRDESLRKTSALCWWPFRL